MYTDLYMLTIFAITWPVLNHGLGRRSDILDAVGCHALPWKNTRPTKMIRTAGCVAMLRGQASPGLCPTWKKRDGNS